MVIETQLPDIPPFEALKLYFLNPVEVCPTSLIEDSLIFLLETEQAAREYNTLPFGGGLWDQPTVLLSAFSTIRAERNHFERIRMEEIRSKQKRENTGTPGARTIHRSDNEALPPRQRPVH